MIYDIETVQELIDELGGPTKLGNWLGISQEAVSAFPRRGIPPGWHVRMIAELKRRGKTFDPSSVFGISDGDAAVLFPPQVAAS